MKKQLYLNVWFFDDSYWCVVADSIAKKAPYNFKGEIIDLANIMGSTFWINEAELRKLIEDFKLRDDE